MKKVFGVGINDADYVVQPRINGKQIICPFYAKWKGMLERGYSDKYLLKQPTYQGCKVCDEWLIFSNFKTWMKTQDWQNKQLDKDILGNGKLYSSKTCCFIEQWLNGLLQEHRLKVRNLPLGVYRKENRLEVYLRCGGKSCYLGSYSDPQLAHQAYLKAKRSYVTNKMKDYPDQRVRKAVLRKVAA